MTTALLNELKTKLAYDPETGEFKWLTSDGRGRSKTGVGTISNSGYRIIYLGGRRHCAHRLAWLYVHGVLPEAEIDHINRIRHDNRIVNLRTATRKQNSENVPPHADGTYGMRGVYWHARATKWMAQICHNGKQRYLGLFVSAEEAKAAYAQAAADSFTHQEI